MNKLNDILSVIDGYIGGSNWFVFLLLGTGIFFTVYLRFPQFRYMRYAVSIVRGKFDRASDRGDTTHFQALATALSGTVGTGNIAGVALAIHLGGPAALFWMLVTALVGMTTKFVEVTLSHKYREITADGTVSGGPMYFLRDRLKMRWLAVIFAAATVLSAFGTGSLPQINSIANSVYASFGINKALTGAILAIVLGFVVIGGIKRIAKVTSHLVPFMAMLYFIGSIVVLACNYRNIVPSLLSIFTDVFTGTAAVGGFIGSGFSFAFNRGVNRGLFSNEAGQGSAPIAHASARAHEPVSEGLVALLEPFIDTVIICMLTGLTILASGVWHEKVDNRFQRTDMLILERHITEADATEMFHSNSLPLFTGQLEFGNGVMTAPHTIIHSRSVAENVRAYTVGNVPYSGTVTVNRGAIVGHEHVYFQGQSLIHSAPLTNAAFTKSLFGKFGGIIVTACLLLFAFSTTIAWSYYGDRAIVFLFGLKGKLWFHILFVIFFFLASFVDTTIVWTLSGIAVALMTIPNLLGLLMLHKEMKSEVRKFWKEYAARFPDEKTFKDL
ncbi:MAG: sodium:alanine symporter family protein [Bacteroidales bacterium]|jgi:AGCS family alanine or glycine:cation symporter|nr:sodium:alanine symporter family protein [Bacteroidales bacterium]